MLDLCRLLGRECFLALILSDQITGHKQTSKTPLNPTHGSREKDRHSRQGQKTDRERQTDKQTGRVERQTDRQTGRVDRQTERDRQKDRQVGLHWI